MWGAKYFTRSVIARPGWTTAAGRSADRFSPAPEQSPEANPRLSPQGNARHLEEPLPSGKAKSALTQPADRPGSYLLINIRTSLCRECNLCRMLGHESIVACGL